jgi:hypothetical protein
MKESLRSHIELLFENAPKTRRAFELKEELFTNSVERYDDLVNNGNTPEDSYKNVVNSIGNVEELFKGLEAASEDELKKEDAAIKKLAVIKAAAIGLYIFSVVVFLWCGVTGFSYFHRVDMMSTGLIAMLLIDIIPTCMLVYASSAYPKYKRRDNTVVEEFKAWKSEYQKEKAVKGAIYTVLWTGVLILYFAISFATGAWFISWVIFLVGACANAVVELVFRLKEMKK